MKVKVEIDVSPDPIFCDSDEGTCEHLFRGQCEHFHENLAHTFPEKGEPDRYEKCDDCKMACEETATSIPIRIIVVGSDVGLGLSLHRDRVQGAHKILRNIELSQASEIDDLCLNIEALRREDSLFRERVAAVEIILIMSRRYVLRLPEPFIKRLFHRKCFMVLKEFRNIRRSYQF